MSAKHTSGPWIATEARHREIEITTQARIDSSQGSICEMDIHFDGVHGIEQPANARLIAAAPDLLAALQKYVAFEELCNGPEAKGFPRYSLAVAAIAKASMDSSPNSDTVK